MSKSYLTHYLGEAIVCVVYGYNIHVDVMVNQDVFRMSASGQDDIPFQNLTNSFLPVK